MPRPPGLRDATSADLARILALNRRHEQETSALDPASLARLVAGSFRTLVGERGEAAFLIALDQGADYGSPNFQWFRSRLQRFVYVDRVIVAPEERGRGWARRLYQHLFAEARAAGHDQVVCEVNLDPPNPGSDAFHAALGFTEQGRAAIYGGSKTVRYLGRALSSPS